MASEYFMAIEEEDQTEDKRAKMAIKLRPAMPIEIDNDGMDLMDIYSNSSGAR